MNEFTQMLKESLEARLGAEARVEETSVLKNNGVMEKGLSVCRKGSRVSPVIYVSELYARYQAGEAVLEIADDLIRFLEKDVLPITLDTTEYTDFEKAGPRIVYKLVNYEKNRKLLSQVPHERFMDLALVYQYLVKGEKERDRDASVLVKNEHLAMWGIGIDELRDVARENTPRLLPAAIIGMTDVLKQFLPPHLIAEVTDCEVKLYVMSNEKRIYGAATMAYPNAVKNFAETCGKNVYVIPSSVHEVILVPEYEGCGRNLNEMVREVNRTALNPKEVLADHVYYFDRAEGTLEAV